MRTFDLKNRTFVQKVMLLGVIASLFLTYGCNADIGNYDEGPHAGEPYQVTIWNRSQFELRAIKLSNFTPSSASMPADDMGMSGSDAARDGEMGGVPDVSSSAWASGERDLLTLEQRPLGQEEVLVVDGFVSGATLSVMRERAAGAGLIEVSSAQGLYPDADGYTIIVFDDTFRLLTPWSEDNPYGQ